MRRVFEEDLESPRRPSPPVFSLSKITSRTIPQSCHEVAIWRRDWTKVPRKLLLLSGGLPANKRDTTLLQSANSLAHHQHVPPAVPFGHPVPTVGQTEQNCRPLPHRCTPNRDRILHNYLLPPIHMNELGRGELGTSRLCKEHA